MNRNFLFIALCAILFLSGCAGNDGRWSVEKANEWYKDQGWIVGCNYKPYYAVDTIDEWQEETFDTVVMDRELGYAEGLGFNTVRVFLSSIVYFDDPQGFKRRFSQFLDLCEDHGIRVIPTFWGSGNGSVPDAHVGKQPDPIPGVHNSRTVPCPGAAYINDKSKWPVIEGMLKDIIKTYRKDDRILMWCLYNEPENIGTGIESSVPLMSATFKWARECKPTQPLTAPITYLIGSPKTRMPEVSFILENSDVISFHCYSKGETLEKCIKQLLTYGRPMVCTEYMGRPASTFEEAMPIFKKYNIGAINWGLCAGKDNTIYPWNKRDENGHVIPWESEPEIWFHNIFHPDGTPYIEQEVEFIRKMTGVRK